MSLLDHSSPTLPEIVRYTDLSFADSTTIDRDIARLFEDVLQSRRSSTEAFATLHAFTNRASEQLAQQGLHLLLSPLGRALRMHSGKLDFIFCHIFL